MKLLIGEVEHEEIIYKLGAPTTQVGLLPALENYYPSSVAKALIIISGSCEDVYGDCDVCSSSCYDTGI